MFGEDSILIVSMKITTSFFHDCVFITCKIFLHTFCTSPHSQSFTLFLTLLWHTGTENSNIKTENPNSKNYKGICSLCQISPNVFACLLICCHFVRQRVSQRTYTEFLLWVFYFWSYQNKSSIVGLFGGVYFLHSCSVCCWGGNQKNHTSTTDSTRSCQEHKWLLWHLEWNQGRQRSLPAEDSQGTKSFCLLDR